MAGGKRHLLQRRGVPRGEQDAAIVGVVLDLVDHLRELIHALSLVVRVHVPVLRAEVAPLEAVHGPEIALLAVAQPDAVQVLAAAVTVPDVNILILQLLRAGATAHEPQQLLRDAAPEDAFGREQREVAAQVEPHLLSELADRPGARAVTLHVPLLDDLADQVQVLQLLVTHARRRRRLGHDLGSSRAELPRVGVRPRVRQKLNLRAVPLANHRRRRVQLEPRGVYRGEERVALERLRRLGRCGHLGEMHRLAQRRRERLGVHLRASDDENALHGGGVLRGRHELEGGVEGVAEDDALGENFGCLAVAVPRGGVLRASLDEGAGLGEDDVEAAREGAELGGDGLPGLAAHDDGVAGAGLVHLGGDGLEVGHVLGEAPGEGAVEADAHLVLGGGDHHVEGARGGGGHLVDGVSGC